MTTCGFLAKKNRLTHLSLSALANF